MDNHEADCGKALRWDRWSPLSMIDLRDCDLSHVDLEGANMLGMNAQGASFRYARLSGANLTNADLRGCDLAHAILDDCNLDQARLDEANLLETSFQRGRLNHASLTEATLWNTNFQQAMMNQSTLQGVRIHGCDMSEVSLWQADLQEAFVKDTSFAGANLSEANGQRCNFFENVDLSDAYLWESDFRNAEGKIGDQISRAKVSDYCIMPDGSRAIASSQRGLVTLQKGELFECERQHKHLKVLTQLVWVTDSSGSDQVLNAGEYLDLNNKSGTAVSAVSEGRATFMVW